MFAVLERYTIEHMVHTYSGFEPVRRSVQDLKIADISGTSQCIRNGLCRAIPSQASRSCDS